MLTEALSAIDRLEELEPGWDSYDADPVDKSAREQAKGFLLRLVHAIGREYTPPIIGPTADGGVALIWRGKGTPHDVEVFLSPFEQRYVVLKDGQLVERGPATDPVSFATRVVKHYVTP